MKSEEKQFSPQESLQVIRSMIETTKHSMSDKSHYYLLWGWMAFTGCITQYILRVIVKYPHHYYAWFVTPVALIIFFFMIAHDRKKERITSFISQANASVWLVVGLSFIPLSFIFSKIGWQYSFPFYILLYGIGTAISGRLIKFKPLWFGGLSCLILACLAPFLIYEQQMLITAFALLISYIIPGHLLRNKYQQQKKMVHE